MRNNTILILLIALILASCKEHINPREEYMAINNSDKRDEHPGKKLMESNCYVCHSPTGSHDNRLAPPMIAVKKHYINEETTKEEFRNSVLAWIENPNVEDAKMFGAIKRFGVMPKQYFSKEVIIQITDYLYDNEIEQPEWFDEHFKGMKKDKN